VGTTRPQAGRRVGSVSTASYHHRDPKIYCNSSMVSWMPLLHRTPPACFRFLTRSLPASFEAGLRCMWIGAVGRGTSIRLAK
jgi:hypothetical protein